MHNLKHKAILGALCRLVREQAECVPSEPEYKTNDGNGCNYICGHVLIWLTKSLPFLLYFLVSASAIIFISHFLYICLSLSLLVPVFVDK